MSAIPASKVGAYLNGQQPFWRTFWIAWAGVGSIWWAAIVILARRAPGLLGTPESDGRVIDMFLAFAVGSTGLVVGLVALWRVLQNRRHPPLAWAAFGLAALVTIAALAPVALIAVYLLFV